MKFVNRSIVFVAALLLTHATEAAVTRAEQRIVGGTPTTIAEYPFITSVLRTGDLVTFSQICVGSIITSRSILSAAHCFRDSANRFRIRVGSSLANSGGFVDNVYGYTNHPEFRWINMDNDISIVRTANLIVYIKNAVESVALAGANYNIPDDSPVVVSGWNNLNSDGPTSEQLHHTFIWTVNQQLCRSNYAELGFIITPNMICAGWRDVGGRGQCIEDSGSPLIHHNHNINERVVLGVTSFNHHCGHPRYFGISTRVSNYISWIINNT